MREGYVRAGPTIEVVEESVDQAVSGADRGMCGWPQRTLSASRPVRLRLLPVRLQVEQLDDLFEFVP
jgi:hypothetical protein